MPPTDLPELAGLTVFPDQKDAQVLYYLPPGLELATLPNGDPDFYLLRYHGDFAAAEGGLLRFRLNFSGPAPDAQQGLQAKGYQLRQVGFYAGRFRLSLRSMQESKQADSGSWRPLSLTSDEASVSALSLTPRETQFLESLLTDGVSAVTVDSELHYTGVVPGMPVLVTLDVPKLRPLLTAMLPPDPVEADHIVAAFLSMPEGDSSPIAWRLLQPIAAPPTRDAIVSEAALRAIPLLFDTQLAADSFAAAVHSLRAASANDPVQRDIDLIPPRQQGQSLQLSWSVTALYQDLSDTERRQRLFPPVGNVSPFANVDVSVINRLPYDPHYLRKATVDLRYSGAAGVPETKSCTFDGANQLFRFSVTYPSAVADFQLSYRLTTFLSPPGGAGWPVIHKGDFLKADGPVVEINQQLAGMDFLRIEAEPQVFQRAAWIEVSVHRQSTAEVVTELRLDVEHPGAWVALPDIPPGEALAARVMAHGKGNPEPPPCSMGDGQIQDRRVSLQGWQLEALDPDRITVRMDPAAAPRFALLNVTLATMTEEGNTFPLGADSPVYWNLFRDSVFDPISYRYRLSYVLVDANGQTQPLASSDWIAEHETELVVGVPEGA
jgi:hypothetical protein